MFGKKNKVPEVPIAPANKVMEIQEAQQPKPIPQPQEDYAVPEDRVKKKEMSTEPAVEEVTQKVPMEDPTEIQEENQEQELTEETAKQLFSSILYRLGRIEHYLRLDY